MRWRMKSRRESNNKCSIFELPSHRLSECMLQPWQRGNISRYPKRLYPSHGTDQREGDLRLYLPGPGEVCVVELVEKVATTQHYQSIFKWTIAKEIQRSHIWLCKKKLLKRKLKADVKRVKSLQNSWGLFKPTITGAPVECVVKIREGSTEASWVNKPSWRAYKRQKGFIQKMKVLFKWEAKLWQKKCKQTPPNQGAHH